MQHHIHETLWSLPTFCGSGMQNAFSAVSSMNPFRCKVVITCRDQKISWGSIRTITRLQTPGDDTERDIQRSTTTATPVLNLFVELPLGLFWAWYKFTKIKLLKIWRHRSKLNLLSKFAIQHALDVFTFYENKTMLGLPVFPRGRGPYSAPVALTQILLVP